MTDHLFVPLIKGRSERITSPGRVLVVANHVGDPCVILRPTRMRDLNGPITLNPAEAQQLIADLVDALRLLGEYPN